MPDPTAHIFLSYARADGRQHVQQLDAALHEHHLPTWWDKRNIDPAQDFTVAIEKGIKSAALVAVCLTPDIERETSFVRREVQYALLAGKPVLPLRFAPGVLPPVHLANHAWIDFVGRPFDEALAEVLAAIEQVQAGRYPPFSAPENDPFRPYLRRAYEAVVYFLDRTVLSDEVIHLHASAAPDAVLPPSSRASISMAFFDMAGIAPVPRGGNSTLYRDFGAAVERYEGRVLLLGQPGSGKTTTLFAFARDAIARRLDDPARPLPVLAPIATWDASKDTPFAAWLAAQASGIDAPALANEIEGGRALLILDGLDELGGRVDTPEDESAADPRARFLDHLPVQGGVIVSCRVHDYAEVGQKAALNGAVTLQELDDAQMQAYLAGLPRLWEALQRDPDLRDIARRPLLLSFMAYAFGDADADLQALADLSAVELRDAIFETYVRRRYQHEARKPHADLPFSLAAMVGRLGDLAILDAYRQQDNLIAVEEVDLPAGGRDAFLELAARLNLVVRRDESTFRFNHLLLRDYFACRRALEHLSEGGNARDLDMSAKALGRIGDRRGIDLLLAIIQHDKRATVRAGVAWALGVFREERARPLLIEVLSDDSSSVRANAATALGWLGDPAAIEPLAALLDDERVVYFRQTVAEFAVRALQRIGTEEALAVVASWRGAPL
jgi:hypothetical protein